MQTLWAEGVVRFPPSSDVVITRRSPTEAGLMYVRFKDGPRVAVFQNDHSDALSDVFGQLDDNHDESLALDATILGFDGFAVQWIHTLLSLNGNQVPGHYLYNRDVRAHLQTLHADNDWQRFADVVRATHFLGYAPVLLKLLGLYLAHNLPVAPPLADAVAAEIAADEAWLRNDRVQHLLKNVENSRWRAAAANVCHW